jgi:DNA repair protein RadD
VEPRAPSHGTKASDAPAIAEPEDVQVKRVAYAPHVKPGKTTSMCVSYHTDQGWIDEWVCIEHGGYAREKAVTWWNKRSSHMVPSTVAEALERISELRIPQALKVQREGQFWRVKGYFWHGDPAAELDAREESLKVQRLRDAERSARLPLSPVSDEEIPF